MDEAADPVVALCARVLPPSPSTTGDQAAEVAHRLVPYLKRGYIHGISVDVGPGYSKAPSRVRPIPHHRFVARAKETGGKAGRLLGALAEGRRLVRAGTELMPRAVICLSDPPLLPFWMGRACARRGVPWVYWSLDLYPEAFASAGLVTPRNPLYRCLEASLRAHPPGFIIALGPNQLEHLRRFYRADIPGVVIPCGLHEEPAAEERPAWLPEAQRIDFCYAGNLGEAHSAAFLEAFLEVLDPARHRLILSAYGARAAGVLARAEGHPAVIRPEWIGREEMAWADVHLVTLKAGWEHVCVPSKAVSAVCSGSTLLYHGRPEADTHALLRDALWHIGESEDKAILRGKLSTFLQELDVRAIEARRRAAARISERLQEETAASIEALGQWLARQTG